MTEAVANLHEPKVQSLVLDATPLITQHVSTLQQFAKQFYTTPGVFNEIKDEHARRNLALWGESLVVRHPKNEFIKKVNDFAKMTGDSQVLSANDIHIIALTYELEVELNHGDWRLRKYPGEKLEHLKSKKEEDAVKQDTENVKKEETTEEVKETEENKDTEVKEKKKRRRGGKKQRAKREAALQAELDAEVEEEAEEGESNLAETTEKLETLQINQESKPENTQQKQDSEAPLDEEFDDSDDDGEWIDQDNLMQEMIKDSGEKIESQSQLSKTKIKVALSSQDFAVQNVSLQIGLNLMNTLSGLQIKRVRNYMLRCYGCFRMLPFPKDGKPKHFCPYCGGQTLLRCAVSVDSRTGEITPHLKANFEWHRRGDRYSLASPLSKASQRRMGKKGYVHGKSNKERINEEPILREDQKEYAKAVKDDDWLRRQNEKVLNDYIGGGSADNFISPFAAQGFRSGGVKVGRGKFANSSRRKK